LHFINCACFCAKKGVEMNDEPPQGVSAAVRSGRGSQGDDPKTLIIILVVLGVVLRELRWVLSPFVIAGFLAFLLTPLLEWISTRTRTPRYLWAIGAFIVIVGALAVIGVLGAPPLINELTSFVTDLQDIFGTLAHNIFGDKSVPVFGKEMDAEQMAQAAAESIRDWIGQTSRLADLSTVAFAGLVSGVLTLVLLFYLLLSGPKIMRALLWLAPENKRPLIQEIWTQFSPLLWRYFLGVLVVVIYATIAAYIGLGLFLGLRHAVFLAVLTGILEMVPVVGPGASALIAGLVALRNATAIGPIIGYAVYAIALRLSIDQFLSPLVLGAAAQLHPVLIIFCFLAGGALFGLPGIVLSVPIALAVKISLCVIRQEPTGVETARG
jgi:predicted PurR-regulated permease PerM